jgi:hypothetical protein
MTVISYIREVALHAARTLNPAGMFGKGVTGQEVANDRQMAAKPTAEFGNTWLSPTQFRRAPGTSNDDHLLPLLQNSNLKHIHPDNTFSH